jgi:soluble lytic murein transglycosylase
MAAFTAIVAACRGQSAEPKIEPPPSAAKDSGLTDAGFAGPFDPPALRVVLQDARLVDARTRATVRDWSGAARALDSARTAAGRAPPSPEEECSWSYLSGRLHLAADEPAPAALDFDRVAGQSLPKVDCALAGYASLRAAQAYARLGRNEEAAARARATPADLALHEDANLVLADALAATGDRPGALRLWRAHTASPRGGWVDVAVRVATALLDGVDGDPASHATEARDLATRVILEAPKIAETSGAVLARGRATMLLRSKDPTAALDLTPGERAHQARAWLDGGEPTKAYAEATAVLAAADKDPVVGCGAAVTRAQASTHMPHVVTADAWGEAILLCSQHPDESLATALYAGAKASLGAKRLDEAADRFARVEQAFPAHRLADDARLQGALIALQRGDEARFASMLLALPDDYPQGDMRGEALFRVALLRMTKRDWEGAKPVLDRIITLFPTDRHWATVGRAAYFRARASAATGDAADAHARYMKIVEQYPLAFYMTQAYARLAEADPSAARHVLDDAVAHEAPGSLFTRDHPELRTVAFTRALRLLEVGDVEAGSRELAAAGLTTDGADAELVWAAGQLFDRADAPELGHAFARRRVSDHLAHYPAGRWRAMWEVAFPRAFESLAVRESSANGIPPSLTWAIMREESDFYPEAKSASNAYGLMQLIVSTARGVAPGTPYGWTEDALKRPDASIGLGTKLLAGLRGSFTNTALAIAAYNGGGGAVGRWVAARGAEPFDLWVEDIPWEETRGYIKRVLASEAAYAFLYDRGALDEVLTIPASVTSVPQVGRGAD